MCADYALGAPMIAVEALMALRELLQAVGGGRDISSSVSDTSAYSDVVGAELTEMSAMLVCPVPLLLMKTCKG